MAQTEYIKRIEVTRPQFSFFLATPIKGCHCEARRAVAISWYHLPNYCAVSEIVPGDSHGASYNAPRNDSGSGQTRPQFSFFLGYANKRMSLRGSQSLAISWYHLPNYCAVSEIVPGDSHGASYNAPRNDSGSGQARSQFSFFLHASPWLSQRERQVTLYFISGGILWIAIFGCGWPSVSVG